MSQYSRRDVLEAGIAAVAAPAVPRAQARSSSRPNILFIMDDQHRGDCTAADGNRAIHTPNIDSNRPRGRSVQPHLLHHAHLHPGTQRFAHRSFAMESRNASHGRNGSTVSAHQAAGAARRRLLHHGHRARCTTIRNGTFTVFIAYYSMNRDAFSHPSSAAITGPGSGRRRLTSIPTPRVSASTTAPLNLNSEVEGKVRVDWADGS